MCGIKKKYLIDSRLIAFYHINTFKLKSEEKIGLFLNMPKVRAENKLYDVAYIMPSKEGVAKLIRDVSETEEEYVKNVENVDFGEVDI